MANGIVERAYKEVFEDWTDGTVIGTSATTAGIKWMNSSDGGDTAFVETDHADGVIARGVSAVTDNDMLEIAHRALSWSVQNGELLLETRIRCTNITDVAINVGFNDDQLDDSNTLPAELSVVTWTSNATTWIGVAYDTDATNDDFHAFWVDDGNDSSEAIGDLRFTGMVPVASEWIGIRIVLKDRGSGNGVQAEFTICEESTGKLMQKVFTTNVDRDALLAPHIAFENRAGTNTHTFDIDYIKVRQSRATT